MARQSMKDRAMLMKFIDGAPWFGFFFSGGLDDDELTFSFFLPHRAIDEDVCSRGSKLGTFDLLQVLKCGELTSSGLPIHIMFC
jgi:hypothetical protein